MSSLQNKVVLLTGASRGIGATAAGALGACGASLIAQHRDSEDLDGVRQATATIPDERKHFVAADFEDRHAADSLWDAAVRWKPDIDVVVLNAAMMHPAGGIDDADDIWDAAWDRHYQVNVQAPVRLMRAAVPHFRERGGGIIIVMSSWVAQRGASNPQMIAYAASKAALKAAAQSVARGYAKDRILTYILAPGIVRTKMSVDFANLQGGEDAVTSSLAMREWVPPQELAELIAFLAEGSVPQLSGATLDVNGATYIR
ncbi:MAG: SDR family oxidoreductase [Gammaproteobacteria bacterium]|nr:SDR family oxidoreductase [Gammaproteobacteria bacterium]